MNVEFTERELDALRTMTLFNYTRSPWPLDHVFSKWRWALHQKIVEAHKASQA